MPVGVLARAGAFIAALDLLAQASVPLSAYAMGTRVSWALPLAVGLVIAAARGPVRRTVRRRVRPALLVRSAARALADARGAADAGADDALWQAHLAERMMLVNGPAVAGALAATALALLLFARTFGAPGVVAATVLLAVLLAARTSLSRRLRPALEQFLGARATMAARMSAAARDAGEIRAAPARAAFLAATRRDAERWTDAESVAEAEARRQRLAIAAAAALGGIAVFSAATGASPSWWLSLGARGLDAGDLRAVALGLAFIAPALSLLRGYEELAVDREQLRLAELALLPRAEPARTPMTAPPTMLRAREVTVRFGDRTALAGVSFAVELAGVTALAGPNGAGKSTLARIIAGVLEPDAGAIELDGITAAEVDPSAVALVPQNPVLIESLSVAENVRLVCPHAGDADVVAALADLGLEVNPTQACGALSRGEQRRVAIARALLARPVLLVLDEPDAWLDSRGRVALSAALKRQRSRCAVVVASHRADLLRWVDRVVLLSAAHGVEAVGPPADLAARSAAFARLVETVADEALALGAETRVAG